MTVAAILGAIPGLLAWFLLGHLMDSDAAKARLAVGGTDTSLGQAWASRWTRYGVLWGAGSMLIGLVVVFVSGSVHPPEGNDVPRVVIALLVAVFSAGLSGGMITQRRTQLVNRCAKS